MIYKIRVIETKSEVSEVTLESDLRIDQVNDIINETIAVGECTTDSILLQLSEYDGIKQAECETLNSRGIIEVTDLDGYTDKRHVDASYDFETDSEYQEGNFIYDCVKELVLPEVDD